MRKLLALACVICAAPVLLADGNSASATINSSVKIYAPVLIQRHMDVSFGNIVLGDLVNPAAVTLDPATLQLKDFENCAKMNGPSSVQPGCFHFQHDADAAVTLELTATPMTGGTGGDVILAPAKSADIPYNIGLPAFMTQGRFWVGGTLAIPAGAHGIKVGTVTATLAYN